MNGWTTAGAGVGPPSGLEASFGEDLSSSDSNQSASHSEFVIVESWNNGWALSRPMIDPSDAA